MIKNVFCLILLTLTHSFPDFRVKLFYASLQKDSHLKPQKGAYLQDSFRTDTLAPFAGAVVTSLASLDKRMTASEHQTLCYRVAFISGLLFMGLGLGVAVIKRNPQIKKAKTSSNNFFASSEL